jgi:hypothetical protein
VKVPEDVTDEQLSNAIRDSVTKLIDTIRDQGKLVDIACLIMIPNTEAREFTGCFFGTLPAGVAKDLIVAVADGEEFDPKTQTTH